MTIEQIGIGIGAELIGEVLIGRVHRRRLCSRDLLGAPGTAGTPTPTPARSTRLALPTRANRE